MRFLEIIPRKLFPAQWFWLLKRLWQMYIRRQKILTHEEMRRLQKYHDLIAGSGGRVDVLTREEQRDMKDILKRRMVEQGVYTPEEAKRL